MGRIFFTCAGEDRARSEDIPLFDPENGLHRDLVAGKLALLDTLTRRLLGSASASPKKRKADDAQGSLL